MNQFKYTFDFDPFGDELFPPIARAELAAAAQVSFIESIQTTPIFHALWKDIHQKASPDVEWWESIRARVRKLVCKCDAFLDKYLEDHPLRFDDWPKYSWELHNAVNTKLEKPQLTWEQFQRNYPQWKHVDGHRIGIVAVNYESLGGTETFHQTLVPRLPNVIGFASRNPLQGDLELLRVPSGHGVAAIQSLASQCDSIISWNIDWETFPRPKRVITVHHGSTHDDWGTRLCFQGDKIVCVNPKVAEHVRHLTDKPVYCIEPAVDPLRIGPRQTVETHGKRICLWSHRFHADKRPQFAIEIARHLPPDWHMVLTGHRGEPIEPNDRVTVLPPTHPGDWLSVASCFLSTSLFEGFGLSVAEAIAAGVPVVSTPTGIANRPGVAITLPTEASPSDWAQAIASSGQQELPDRKLFPIADHIEAWWGVLRA